MRDAAAVKKDSGLYRDIFPVVLLDAPRHEEHAQRNERESLTQPELLEVPGLKFRELVAPVRGAARALAEVRLLVHKDHNRKAYPGMRADFTGLDVADRFLFGCGMDYKGYWRNAPGIYALKGH